MSMISRAFAGRTEHRLLRSLKSPVKHALKRLLWIRRPSVAEESRPPKQIWSIGIYAGESPFFMSPARAVDNPVLTAGSVRDVPAVFVADPFMIKASRNWNMFFEVLNSASGRGEIGLASSEDAISWTYRQIVLREPFHLSYPHVFEWDGHYYLIPESYEANSVRLYRATDFPLSWEFAGDLLTGGDFEDSSLFRFNERWWLFTDHADQPYYAGRLRLFHAEHLEGPWREHPRSPIIDGDPHIARPAGRVLIWNNRVFRFTQDCCPVYGAQVHAFEITELTPTTFEEEPVGNDPIVGGSGAGWNAGGMHHIDAHLNDDGRWIACVDGWHWES